MTIMPSEYLDKYGGIAVDDAHLAWIGAITTYFAFGEQAIELLISLLSRTDPESYIEFYRERTINFERKTDCAKKLMRKLFPDGSKALDIGVALMTRGKELSKSRKLAAHWIAQSRADSLLFSDLGGAMMGLEISDVAETIKSDDDLFKLALDIKLWSMDVIRFPMLALVFGSVKVNIAGNIPLGIKLDWDQFGSIQPSTRRAKKT